MVSFTLATSPQGKALVPCCDCGGEEKSSCPCEKCSPTCSQSLCCLNCLGSLNGKQILTNISILNGSVHQFQHTLAPYSLIAVWFGRFNILAASFREIFSYAFSRQAAISSRIVSKRMSMKKL